MQQIISLGCSLTAQAGYVKYLNLAHNLNIQNLAVSAGSNELQSFRLNNLLVNNQVSRDAILLWQITGPWRSLRTFSAKDSKPYINKLGDPTEKECLYDCFYENTGLYNQQSLVLLCNHPYFDNYLHNISYNLHSTTCDIFKWSFLVKHIIVYLGWSWPDDGQVDKSLEFLKTAENITVIPKENNILDVCKNNNWVITDDSHPTEESYIKWCKQVLEPVLLSKLKS